MGTIISACNWKFQETERSLRNFLEPSEKPKVICTDNSLDFGQACEESSWNHCTSTPHRSETNGIAGRAVRRIKEGISGVLLQSGLDEKWWADSMDCYCHLRNIQDLLSDGKILYERWSGDPFKGPVFPFGPLVEHHLRIWFFLRKTSQDSINWVRKCYTWNIPWICIVWGGNLERRYFGRRHWGAGTLTRVRNPCSETQSKKVITPRSGENFTYPIAGGPLKLSGGDQGIRKSTSMLDKPERGEELRDDLRGESASQPLDITTDDSGARNDFWSIEANCIYGHHVEPRVQLFVPKEESFPFAVKYIDLTRFTHSDLEVMQDKKIDDHWNGLAGLLPKGPLETRFDAVIETATSTCLSARDDEDQATAKLYVQKSALAAEEAWQRTIGGLQGPLTWSGEQILPWTCCRKDQWMIIGTLMAIESCLNLGLVSHSSQY